jgi:hypothetical protein
MWNGVNTPLPRTGTNDGQPLLRGEDTVVRAPHPGAEAALSAIPSRLKLSTTPPISLHTLLPGPPDRAGVDEYLPICAVHGIMAHAMKNRVGVIVLALLCLGLGIALIVVGMNAAKQQRESAGTILDYSNRWSGSSLEVDKQKLKITTLETNLDSQKKALNELSNTYIQVSASLLQTSNTLAKTESALKASQVEITKRDAEISDLATQNKALDKQAMDLSAAITNLTTQILDTQKRLASSEGDKVFLEKELQRLVAEKAELERQFNDLAVVRAQVAKLKEELNISRRIEWIRQGLFGSSDQRGAQKLMQGLPAAQPSSKTPRPTYDLNVEIGADGSVKVIPPLSGRPAETNSPAVK